MKIIKVILPIILCSLLVTGCSNKNKISFTCDKDKKGDYIIRWEVYPNKCEEKISVYMSDNDSVFADPPIFVKNVNDYIAKVVTNDSLNRKFFQLKVGNSVSGIISNRHFELDQIQNFRDLGGYFNKEEKQLKWAKLYRSADFSSISNDDYKCLQNLSIKTVIDFRSCKNLQTKPDLYRGNRIISLPIETTYRDYIKDKIIDGTFSRDDAIINTKNAYKSIIGLETEVYAQLFDILCDESNYPVVLHGELGKDKTGIASYFILKALDVSEDIIEKDYLLSNNYVSEIHVIGEAKYLSEKMQEAATVICKVDPSYIDNIEEYINKEYGSIDAYMEKELRLTHEKKEKLKKILLY